MRLLRSYHALTLSGVSYSLPGRAMCSLIRKTENSTGHFCEDTRQNALAALTNLGHGTPCLLLGPAHHILHVGSDSGHNQTCSDGQ